MLLESFLGGTLVPQRRPSCTWHPSVPFRVPLSKTLLPPTPSCLLRCFLWETCTAVWADGPWTLVLMDTQACGTLNPVHVAPRSGNSWISQC